MSDEMVREALSEIDAIAKQLGCRDDELTLIQVDAAVGSVKPWKGAKSLELTGRGGTDLRAATPAIEAMRTLPSVVVYLTDGETPWPDAKPKGYTVVVGIIGDKARRAYNIEATKNEMPWAQVVEIGGDKD
jgi:predicted metal-dependent peptidase